MSKNEFKKLASSLNCSTHYQGSSKTMFVFGSRSNLSDLSFARVVSPNASTFKVVTQINRLD